MVKAIVKNATTLVVFMLLLSVVVFLLAHLAPGDQLAAYYGESVERMSEAQRAEAMARLGLDRPLVSQYFTWLQNALSGDLGISHQYKQPVAELIAKFWLNTLLLGGLAYLLSFVLATALGLFCASHEGTFIDRLIHRVGTATSVIPSFFIALVFILIFAVNLRLLPTGGAYSLGGGGLADRAWHLVLPVSVLVLSHLWYYASMIRSRIIEELGKDYVLLLRAKRLSRPRILLRHCLRNALPTLVSLMAISVPHIIAGTYVVEMVFAYPGLGTLTFEAARYQDYNMLLALTLLTGLTVLVANLLGQTLSELLDMRMRCDDARPAGVTSFVEYAGVAGLAECAEPAELAEVTSTNERAEVEHG